jgi:DNA-binding IclR family transcriptional regulator
MRRLSDSVRETCLLAVLTPDLHVRLLAKEVSPREIRYDTSLDKLNPAHRIASGRVQLAHLSEIEIAAYVARWTGRSVPPSERLDEVALRTDLAQVREAGVALAIDQWEAGATGISAPIFDASGRVDAAITVGAVTARFLADREEIIAATRQAALDITELQRSRAPAQGRAARDTSPGVVRPIIKNMVSTSQPKGKKHARS